MRQYQHGFLMITTIVCIALFSVLAAVMVHIFVGQMSITADNALASQAFYLAEAGLEKGEHALLADNLNYRLSCSAITDASNMTNVSFDQGLITVTATAYPTGATTTLTSQINATTTTIPVASTLNYAPKGRIRIHQEWIDYPNKTATRFINVTRGANNSTATTHTAGTPIQQQQCLLTTQAGIPDFSTTSVKRTLRHNGAALLGAVWTAGESSPNAENMNYWDGGAWKQQGPYSAIPNVNLSALFISSSIDGWATGDTNDSNAIFIHWNGQTWSRVLPTGTVPNTAFYALTCTANNDCNAVGNPYNNKASIAHWNGSAWTAAIDNGSLANRALRSLSCVNNATCWAVGDRDDNNAFLAYWNGTQWARETINLVSSGSGSVPKVNLTSVSCVANNDCWAIGNRANGPGLEDNSPLFLHWNGSQWARSTAFVTSGSQAVPKENLNAVYCINNADCWAVGDNDSAALFVHWNGLQWQRIPTDAVPATRLNAIHCSATNNCWAVGDSNGSDVIAHWNGNAWNQVGPNANVLDKNLNAVFVLNPIQPMARATYWEELFT